MTEFRLRQGDLYFVDKEIETDLDKICSAEDFFDETLKSFFRERLKYKEYIDLYGKTHSLNRYAVLMGDGGTSDNRWVYSDGKKESVVQSWVDQVDGKYSALLLFVSNPGSHTPTSKQSILVVPDGVIMLGHRSPLYNLLVPEVGEVDPYTVDFEIGSIPR